MALLEVTALTRRGEDNFCLSNITFQQLKEERVAIAGETGSGKSTLLKCIAGLADVEEGEVIFKREKVLGPKDKLVPGHEGIAYLSQLFELPKFLRVEQVLSYANALKAERADLLYQVCRIDHLLTRKTDQLSGGERQRIAIARLLSSSPDLFLLDEPFSHLDGRNKQIMKEVIWDIGHRLKTSVIIVSHDPQDLLSWAQRILVLKEGSIVQSGTPEEIYGTPNSPYVAGLFGRYSRLVKGAGLFKKLVPRGTSAEAVIIRPEHVKLVPRQKTNVKGRVKAIHYYGSYHEVEVEVGEETILGRTTKPDFEVGELVGVTVAAKNIHPVIQQ